MIKTVGTIVLSGMVVGLSTGCGTVSSFKTAEQETAVARVPPAERPNSDTDLPGPEPIELPLSRSGNPESYVVFGNRYHVMDSSENFREQGVASWYGPKFHGRKTSSGTPYDMYEMTAAHKKLPLPTFVKVTHLGNGRSIVVKVNDRGPFSKGRIIDLSYAAAQKLDMVKTGTAPVQVEALPPYQYLAHAAPRRSRTPTARRPTPASWSPQRDLAKAPEFLEQTAPTGSPTAISGEPAYLQVGAFSERRNAEQLQSRLTHRIEETVRIESSNDNLHKVQVGPIADPSQVSLLNMRLAALGINNTHLVYE